MILQRVSIKKRVAFFFLLLWGVETFAPLKTFALTSGPKQPEHTKFEPAGVNNLVDPFTGAFKYNIPLLDIDGYPINLSYGSGVGIDDEASWVGLGWSLNVGSINRQLRGLPDDLNGEEIVTEHYTKPKITVGGRGTVRGELAGKHFASVQGSLSIGLFSDNYNGMGAEFGLNAGLGIGPKNTGSLTGNINIGLNSNTSSGVSTTVSAGLEFCGVKTEHDGSFSESFSASLGYNSREGLKDLTLSDSYGGGHNNQRGQIGISLNTPIVNPKIKIGYKTTSRSLTGEFGGTAWILFGGGGFTGYFNKQEVLNRFNKSYAYGFLYAHNGTNKGNALMDYLREKENPIVTNIPNLPVPILTQDIFSYTSQYGGGQFKLNRGNAAVIFDNLAQDKSSNNSAGADYGVGAIWHGGVALYNQDATNKTGKWSKENNFLSIGDYKLDANQLDEEQAYFKETGEIQAEPLSFTNAIGGTRVVNVSLTGKQASNALKDKNDQQVSAATPLKKYGRQPRNTSISYQTAAEASNSNEKVIKSYGFVGTATALTACPVASTLPRMDKDIRHKDHISTMTVTQNDGKRLVYGLPVYALGEDDYTFGINSTYTPNAKGLIAAPIVNNKIVESTEGDNFFHHEQVPVHATSFLLTSIFSPDYVDVGNDGITEDDKGSAIKFNYTKGTNYKWRTPTEPGTARFSGALLADKYDNKATIATGIREQWYIQSIETKTKIVYFITDDRKDGFGVTDLYGNIDSNNPQKRLAEIRIYSKSDMTTPIKTVVLEHDYSLCTGLPNALSNGGKLTLKSLYFMYGSSTKDNTHKYKFEYPANAPYAFMSTDRWGTYKPVAENQNFGWAFRNDEFPYVNQDYATAKSNASQWNLGKITLPTGGVIDVSYESNDYAYVQDRRAMEMVKIVGMIDKDGQIVQSLGTAKGFRIKKPGPIASGNSPDQTLQNFIRDYLNGRNEFYAKLFVNISDVPNNTSEGYFDYVPAYGELSAITDKGDGNCDVYFKDVSDGGTNVNPFLSAAWQRMRLDYPMYAYPGYKNRINNEIGIEQALNALVASIKNIAELKVSFNERALKKWFGTKVILDKSFARIARADGHKLGGGVRVKQVSISDSWNTIASGPNTAATYGKSYDYSIEENGKSISSGVAAYEPGIGADENPMRMPVPYSQISRGALTNFFYLEEPFGEALFPVPQVGYRKVTVRALNEAGVPDPENATGWTSSEFYTAKDFPVIVDAMTRPDAWQNGPSSWGNFAGGIETFELVMSQGYAVTINDMHGKPKAERVFNQTGVEIASTTYYYKTDELDGSRMRLNNEVKTVDEKGVVRNSEILGREIELVTDMREQEYKDLGKSIHVGADVFSIGPWVMGAGHFPKKNNDSYRLFRSAVTLKTITQSGLVDHITKTINGSSSTITNIAYDRNTGVPVVTSTTNAYNDPVYNVSIPAYWKYKGMSGAYKNINTVFSDFSSDANGVIAAKFWPYLAAGDELLQNSSSRLWVIGTATDADATVKMRLVDDRGDIVKNFSGAVKIVRSGYRNLQGASMASLVCLKNPVAGNTLGVFANADVSSYKVLNASATLYEEAWNGIPCVNCATGKLSPDGQYCIIPATQGKDIYRVITGSENSDYGRFGAIFYNAAGEIGKSSDVLWKNKLSLNGVWINTLTDLSSSNKKWYAIETCLEVPATGTYSIGYAVDNAVEISIDGDTKFSIIPPVTPPTTTYFDYWFVQPVQLTAGTHNLLVKICNYETRARVGMELYDGTPQQMLDNPGYGTSKRIFNLADLLNGKNYNVGFIGDNKGDGIKEVYRSCPGSTYDVCAVPAGCKVPSPNYFNPYIAGMLGNWRASEDKVVVANKTDNQITAEGSQGLDLRNSGTMKTIAPYWYLNNGNWETSPTNTQWISSRYVTSFNQNGEEQENKDALMRYSGVLFGYKNSYATAIAQNARAQEIFYEGFEDYKLMNTCGSMAECVPDQFSMTAALGTVVANPEESHSGNYALRLTKEINLNTTVSNTAFGPGYGVYMTNDATGRYARKSTPGLYSKGFHPSNKKYIFSAWVKGENQTNSKPSLDIKINGRSLDYKVIAVVDGWKKIEGSVDTDGLQQFNLNIPANSALYIDDIRLFPYDALMKSHVYDDKSLRLMATMDENNFATFYEYDDAGVLIRVKKETERGIMTINETRTVIKKD